MIASTEETTDHPTSQFQKSHLSSRTGSLPLDQKTTSLLASSSSCGSPCSPDDQTTKHHNASNFTFDVSHVSQGPFNFLCSRSFFFFQFGKISLGFGQLGHKVIGFFWVSNGLVNLKSVLKLVMNHFCY